eukprot:COSAG06_NODE_1735_length_8524_cov_23.310623_6_plen_96_part_00
MIHFPSTGTERSESTGSKGAFFLHLKRRFDQFVIDHILLGRAECLRGRLAVALGHLQPAAAPAHKTATRCRRRTSSAAATGWKLRENGTFFEFSL